MRAEVEITPYPDGPVLVRGPIRLFDDEGREIELRRRTIAVCRCGHSRIHPLCDGTHKKIGFRSGEQPPRIGAWREPERD
ncbi:MAG: CDGSH iron-sulfur domain-containing protein [Actinomycetota bacterium]|nr:CDGSH iron-sulfur domain-containing protein [Actinomycetota bacterium]